MAWWSVVNSSGQWSVVKTLVTEKTLHPYVHVGYFVAMQELKGVQSLAHRAPRFIIDANMIARAMSSHERV